MLRAAVTCLVLVTLLDRVVISVGLNAITESQLQEELAITAFLNRQPIPSGIEQRREAAHRLVQQTLIRRDMELARFPNPESSQVERTMDRIVNDYGGRELFEQGLKRYGVTAPTVRAHIANQLETLRFIEYRFRPELTISDAELRAAYDRNTANWDRDHHGTARPSFEESRAAVRSELIEKRTGEALDNWLKQTASQTPVVYLDPSLKPAL